MVTKLIYFSKNKIKVSYGLYLYLYLYLKMQIIEIPKARSCSKIKQNILLLCFPYSSTLYYLLIELTVNNILEVTNECADAVTARYQFEQYKAALAWNIRCLSIRMNSVLT